MRKRGEELMQRVYCLQCGVVRNLERREVNAAHEGALDVEGLHCPVCKASPPTSIERV
jgi:hypothetical protein